MVSEIIGGIGGLAALGSAIYGAAKSAKYNDKARALIQDQRDENRRWYNARMNESFTDRVDAQDVINRQRQMLDDRYGRTRRTNVVSGGTDAAEAMEKAAANDAMAQTMSDIASQAADYKDSVEQQYRQQDAALNQQQAQTFANQAQATAQAASQAVNAGVNVLGNAIQEGNINPSPAPSVGDLTPKTQPIGAPAPVLGTGELPRIRKTNA